MATERTSLAKSKDLDEEVGCCVGTATMTSIADMGLYNTWLCSTWNSIPPPCPLARAPLCCFSDKITVYVCIVEPLVFAAGCLAGGILFYAGKKMAEAFIDACSKDQTQTPNENEGVATGREFSTWAHQNGGVRV